ncbi:MAG: hypothetical protein HN931_08590 [Desulfobacterales bacterium]|nr:hypothetical protein [Desulfobacteraceae bacterium]MBT7086216.1 hypothetical protein [Desulfobacterales bacterium]
MTVTGFESKQPTPLQTSDGVVALSHSLSIMSANHVIRWLIGYEPKPGKPFPLDKLFREPDLTRIKSAVNFTL